MKKHPTSRERARGLAAALLLMGLTISLGVTAGPTSASNEVRSAAERSATGVEAGPMVSSSSPSTRSTTETRSLRKGKVWRFYMPVSRAESKSLGFARYMFYNSAPDDYASDVNSDSFWEEYDAGLCKRQSYSKVRCFSYLSAEFDIINGNDQVVDIDEYFCAWYTNVWYPVGKRRALKWNTYSFDCYWRSEV